MRRGCLGLILVLGFAAGASADAGGRTVVAGVRVVVAGVRVEAGLAERRPSLEGVLYPAIRAEITPRISLVTGPEREAAFARLGIGEADLDGDIGACRRFAAAVRADRLLFLRAGSFGDRISLTLLALDPKRSEYTASGSVLCDRVRDVPDAARDLLVAAGYAEKRPPPPRPSPPPPPPARSGSVVVPDAPLLELYPNDACRRLRALKRENRELRPEDPARIAAWTAEARTHLARLKEDPAYREEWAFRTRVSQDPVLRSYACSFAIRRPWFVVGVGREEAPDPGALADALTEFLAFFRARFAPADEFPLRDPLRVLWFESPELLEEYRNMLGDFGADEACYRTRDQWLVLRKHSSDTETLSDAYHVATWQILHALRRARIQEDRNEEVLFSDRSLTFRTTWLNRGLPALLATARPMAAAGGDFAEPTSLDEDLREGIHLGIREWTLPDLVARRDPVGDSRRRYTFDVYAGLFCRFLWEEHRERLVACVQRSLRRRSDAEDLGPTLRGESDDLDPLAAEWKAWIGKHR